MGARGLTINDPMADVATRFAACRALSEALISPLSDADASGQSMPDASPAKWHLAHTTWFWESFVLRDHVPGYQLHDDRWAFLFNSYYEAEGPRHARFSRGLLTRPSLEEVVAWRHKITAAVLHILPDLLLKIPEIVALGIAHEEQHQELLLTDMLHLMAQNPLGPQIWPAIRDTPAQGASPTHPLPLSWIEGAEGPAEIGQSGADNFAFANFTFDSEGPRHAVMLPRHSLANRPATNGEWAAFMADGGYRNSALWLSDGWTWVQREDVHAPLYWRATDHGWEQFTLAGWQPLNMAAPVSNISLYEADAFASWAAAQWSGARLPTEAEWEVAARSSGLDPCDGNQLDIAGPVHPAPASTSDIGLAQMFGDVWEYTGSAFRPYPGFRPSAGAIGEYNGKFMSGQFVLKGASCATVRGHSRASYRNFFYPHQRWQFTGLRLARDVA
jgi:ergothioneine biosynthesis protein EgtB